MEKRGRDKKNDISIRLSYAMSEMSHYNEYRYVIINDKILDTVNTLMSIINYNILITKLDYDIKKKLKFVK